VKRFSLDCSYSFPAHQVGSDRERKYNDQNGITFQIEDLPLLLPHIKKKISRQKKVMLSSGDVRLV